MKYAWKTYLELLSQADMVKEYDLGEEAEHEVGCLTYNSKEVKEDTFFICKGAAFKAQYLAESAEKGAFAYVSEVKYDVDIPYILVKDIRCAMPILAKKFFESPAEKLKVTGITGTKGKSTTTYYIKAIIDDYMDGNGGKESAMISTIDVYDGVIKKESHITTPEAVELQEHFRHAVDSGIEYLTMEVSSQALKYNRVDELEFDTGIFLNISEDHVSPIEHADFEDYFSSKLRIFPQTKTAIVNLDMDFADRTLAEARKAKKVLTFGTKEGADIYGYDIQKDGHNILFRVKCDRFDEDFMLTMPGLFNVENALAAIAVAYEYEIPMEYIKSGLKRARSSGRMEFYPSKDNKIIAIVDYAHNKLSFEKLFDSIRKEYPTYKLCTIFGCPGKKSLARRHDLGTIAGMYSKKVYITAEDPGFEPVEDISKDIAQYVEAQGCPYVMIEDRGEAIKAAIEDVDEPTILLITGKGNETRQKYGSEYLDCPSDVEYTKKYLEEYNNRL